jgi:hypothetical protein
MLNCSRCLFFRRKTIERKEGAGRKQVGTKKQEQAVGKSQSTSSSQTTTSGGATNNDNNQQVMHDAKQELTAAAKPGVQAAVPTRTPNEELAAKLFGSYGAPRRDLITQYCTDNCDFSFAEAHMTIHCFLDETQKILHSFPDFQYHIETITEREDGSVVARGHATGTHTGTPFGFGPYPEIKATGTSVVLDPEYVVPCVCFLSRQAASLTHVMSRTCGCCLVFFSRDCHMTIRDGKVARMRIKPSSEFTGPPGFYLKIGGLIF